MKLDFKSAYRRQHLHGDTAKRCIVTTKDLEDNPIALMSLRQTFGGAAGPPGFSDISTVITDLANALARLPTDVLDALPESIYKDKIGAPTFADLKAELAAALPMRVTPDADGFQTANNYIDDIISSFVMASGLDPKRAAKALMLAFEIASRPLVAHGETLPRDDNMSLGKLFAEGTPSEVETVLGWSLNTRHLEISLPYDKLQLWLRDIDKVLIPNKSASGKQLEQLVGRLNHAAGALPITRHFLASIRTAQYRAQKYRFTRLSAEEKHTLRFWKLILKYIHSGVSLNLTTLRYPNQITISDACTIGLGGFSCNSGRAWQFLIPERLRHKRQINFLEFLACIITQLVEIFEGRSRPGDCFLGRGDNTPSMGWLNSSNFDPDDKPAHAGLARYYAGTLMANELCSYSEWLAGHTNSPADELSRNFDMTHDSLTLHISSLYPSQVPSNFHISPLPAEIECAIYFWLQTDQLPSPFNPALTPQQTGLGLDGYTFSSTSESPMTPSSISGQNWLETVSSLHSLRRSDLDITPSPDAQMLSTYAQMPVRAPSTMWLRPSPTKAFRIPSSTRKRGKSDTTSPDSSAAIGTQTQASNTN